MAIDKRHGHSHRQDDAAARTDFEAVLDHVRENPLVYVAALVFTVVVAVAGVMYFSASEAARKDMATTFVEALLIDDPDERAAELARVAGELRGELAAEALYMAGEAAYRAGEFDQARSFYERVRAEHSGSTLVAAATEGLGYIQQEEGNHEAAMALFREVQNSHATSFEARRQWYNLGRAAEKAGDLDAAVGYYNDQIDGFPGSSIAQQAQAALDRLRRDHPGLVPDAFVLDAPAGSGITLDAPITLDERPALDSMLDGEIPDFSIEPPAAEAPALEDAEDGIIPVEIEQLDSFDEAEAADAADADENAAETEEVETE